ncbi:DUF6934 family protein [Parapedobacter koreensis]|uniref:Uncharacterized protein n=1 Tax=Parapedobacter koreensis TaxID=332977 RepID=A0A1H7UL67_9SPHI|nr:hypothetical protein [Parapedobacter koreensis]SEL97802.1 hypothetical protein SAMN05421740_1188 [Parapedobacter koreensis]
MIEDRYHIEIDDKHTVYEFTSIGPKGDVCKIVKYSETNLKNLFNLGFGDKNPETNEVDDLVVTNNGDSQKVLATVAATVYHFTDRYPDASIIATGSTKARTRLYQMGISNNLEAIEKDFLVYGLKAKKWEPFNKKTTYEAFLVKRKKS